MSASDKPCQSPQSRKFSLMCSGVLIRGTTAISRWIWKTKGNWNFASLLGPSGLGYSAITVISPATWVWFERQIFRVFCSIRPELGFVAMVFERHLVSSKFDLDIPRDCKLLLGYLGRYKKLLGGLGSSRDDIQFGWLRASPLRQKMGWDLIKVLLHLLCFLYRWSKNRKALTLVVIKCRLTDYKYLLMRVILQLCNLWVCVFIPLHWPCNC